MNDKLIDTIEKPLDDSEIKKYLPDAKIVTNLDLNKISDVDELFNRSDYVDYVIILFLDAPNKGHWTALSRCGVPGSGVIEFFDSYGNNPDRVYDFVKKSDRKRLGTSEKKLCHLLNRCKYDVIYNPVKYQEDNKDDLNINTCGRHVCYRILNLIGKGMLLPEYYDFMEHAKEYYKGAPWDVVVSKLINL